MSSVFGFPARCVNKCKAIVLSIDEPTIAVLREQFIAASEGDGPVNEVEIHIVGSQILQRSIKRLLNVIRMVRVIPELGGEKDLVSRDAGLLDGAADSRLGSVTVYRLSEKYRMEKHGEPTSGQCQCVCSRT